MRAMAIAFTGLLAVSPLAACSQSKFSGNGAVMGGKGNADGRGPNGGGPDGGGPNGGGPNGGKADSGGNDASDGNDGKDDGNDGNGKGGKDGGDGNDGNDSGGSSRNGHSDSDEDNGKNDGNGGDSGDSVGGDDVGGDDGDQCLKSVNTPVQAVSTTNSPFKQKAGGESWDYEHWRPKSGEHPLPPQRIDFGFDLKKGDRIKVTSISGTINDSDGHDYGSCQDGTGNEQDLLKHIIIIQFTNDSEVVQDPGVSTYQDSGAFALRDLLTKEFKVPKNVTRAYVSVGDSRYDDNHSSCTFSLSVKHMMPCN